MPRARYYQLKRMQLMLANQSEDCLFLNIYAPSEGLPFFLFFFDPLRGGGGAGGSPDDRYAQDRSIIIERWLLAVTIRKARRTFSFSLLKFVGWYYYWDGGGGVLSVWCFLIHAQLPIRHIQRKEDQIESTHYAFLSSFIEHLAQPANFKFSFLANIDPCDAGFLSSFIPPDPARKSLDWIFKKKKRKMASNLPIIYWHIE